MTMNPEATPFTTVVNLWLRQDNLLQTVSAVAFNPSNPQKRESLLFYIQEARGHILQ